MCGKTWEVLHEWANNKNRIIPLCHITTDDNQDLDMLLAGKILDSSNKTTKYHTIEKNLQNIIK